MEDCNKNIRLSIVIPVYNAEKYLDRCILSCLNQNIEKDSFEILLCNDGSVDSSLSICERYSKQYDCVKVFSQENSGAGMARNLGLSHASGRYVIFVDSDDYLVDNSVLPVLEKSEGQDLDICKYVIECIILDSQKHILRYSPIESGVVFTGDILLGKPEVPLDSACSSLYKRQFLESHNLCFSGQTSSEDVAFNLQVYPNAKRVMFVNDHVYTYEVHTGSRRHSVDYASRKRYLMNNIRNAGHVMKTALGEVSLSVATRKSLVKRANSMTVGLIMEMIKAKDMFTRDDIIEAISLAREVNVYPIKGRSFSWRSTLLSYFFLNRENLLIYSFKE